jgi:hypothetical protein
VTYLCAIHGLSHLGIPDHPTPSVYCDGCGTRIDARSRSGMAPAWLLNGKAPKGWRVERDEENGTRKDWCPRCRASKEKP